MATTKPRLGKSASPTTFDLPSPNAPKGALPRRVPEGTVPLIAVEGTAYDCGRWYAETVRERYPGFRKYLDGQPWWQDMSSEVRRLYERDAPHIIDLFRGLREGAGAPESTASAAPVPIQEGCTSFGVSGSITLDGHPMSGQNKDPDISSAAMYIVLRMRIKDSPTILTLAYPGEVLGYGLWSTGMSVFRNSLYSRSGAEKGISSTEWVYLALAGTSVHDAVDLARRFGLQGNGNYLMSDPQGESLSVEFNAGGVNTIPARDGIATHGNHAEGPDTHPFEAYGDNEGPSERENSRYRMHGLWQLLNAERGRLTPQRALMALADHTYYPQGICRHWVDGKPQMETTGSVIAEPTQGALHVVRGQPCCNWPTTYTI